VIVALVEEGSKMRVINKFIFPLPEFNEINDGIIYTMAGGLGFAFLENLLYSMNSSHSWTLLLIRGVTSVPLHGLASGLMGYYIGRSKFAQKDSRMTGLFWAVLYHGFYDFFRLCGSGDIDLDSYDVTSLFISFDNGGITFLDLCDIRQFAGPESSPDIRLKGRIGIVDGVGFERLFHRDSLFRKPSSLRPEIIL
jgi:hypothetical protein